MNEDRFALATAIDGSCYITDKGRLALWVYGSEVKKDAVSLENAKEYAAAIAEKLNSKLSPDLPEVVIKGV